MTKRIFLMGIMGLMGVMVARGETNISKRLGPASALWFTADRTRYSMVATNPSTNIITVSLAVREEWAGARHWVVSPEPLDRRPPR